MPPLGAYHVTFRDTASTTLAHVGLRPQQVVFLGYLMSQIRSAY